MVIIGNDRRTTFTTQATGGCEVYSLANVFTKVVEKVLYSRMEGYLQSTSNQFGFKRKHGTEMCVFVLKELIRYYIKHGSCMYVAFLDASKAFDRVNHTKLFSKLLRLGVPTWVIKVLVQWYCNQSICVRWGSVFSDFFLVNNGVRQGVFFPHYCLMYYKRAQRVTVKAAYWLLLW